MTDTQEPQEQVQPSLKDKRSGVSQGSKGLTILVVALALALVGQNILYHRAETIKKTPEEIVQDTHSSSQGNGDLQELQNVKRQVETLNKLYQETQAKTQNDLAALTQLSAVLSQKIEAETAHTVSDRQELRAHLFALMALTHLEQRVNQGEPFESDLKSISDSGVLDSRGNSILLKLHDKGEAGVKSIQEIRENFIREAQKAEQSLRRHEAQNWKERFLLTLSSFIRIRPLDKALFEQRIDDDLGRYAPIYNELTENKSDVAAILFDSLSSQARDPLMTWRAQLEERNEVKRQLRALSQIIVSGDQVVVERVEIDNGQVE